MAVQPHTALHEGSYLLDVQGPRIMLQPRRGQEGFREDLHSRNTGLQALFFLFFLMQLSTYGGDTRQRAFAAQAGDMWGQYLAAQRRKEETQHASAAKQRHAGRSMQSRPLEKGSQPRIPDQKRVSCKLSLHPPPEAP